MVCSRSLVPDNALGSYLANPLVGMVGVCGHGQDRQQRAGCLAKPRRPCTKGHLPGPTFSGHEKQPVALRGGMLVSPLVPCGLGMERWPEELNLLPGSVPAS